MKRRRGTKTSALATCFTGVCHHWAHRARTRPSVPPVLKTSTSIGSDDAPCRTHAPAVENRNCNLNGRKPPDSSFHIQRLADAEIQSCGHRKSCIPIHFTEGQTNFTERSLDFILSYRDLRAVLHLYVTLRDMTLMSWRRKVNADPPHRPLRVDY
jgi:hypothetical protein